MVIKDFFNDDGCVHWTALDKVDVIERLSRTKQTPIWHKEDALTHTKLVCEKMHDVLIREGYSYPDFEYKVCMVAAICHDLGKYETTQFINGDYTSPNHGIAGDRVTRKLLINENIVTRELICCMVRNHMILHHVFDDKNKTYDKIIRLSHNIAPIKYMLYLLEADSKGSINDKETDADIDEKVKRIKDICDELNCYESPYDLINKNKLINAWYNNDKELLLDDKQEFNVVILCGLPGSGKTTFYKKYLEDYVLISRDIIRCELGINGATIENDKKTIGTKAEEKNVTNIFNERLVECCEKKMNIVIDNINLKSMYRKDFIKSILKYNPKITIIYVEVPNFIYDCVERRKGEISEKEYDRMYDNFEFPLLNECEKLVIVKQTKDGKYLTNLIKEKKSYELV